MVLGLNPGRRPRWPRRLGIASVLLAAALLASLRPVPPARLRPPGFESLRLFDRHGEALGESLSSAAESATWTPIEHFSPDLVAAAVAAEDRRFQSHFGLDPLAILRAVVSNVQSGKVRSGASTITQQVARMILADEAVARGEPAGRRSLRLKLAEAHLALRLERSFSKQQILEAWLNRVPVGGVAVGMASGADRYFHVSPDTLTLEQSALLVGLPRGPTSLRPDREPAGARRRRNRVLDAMVRAGLITPARADVARSSSLTVARALTQPMRARFGAWVASALKERGRPVAGPTRTTIDASLERELVDLARRHIKPLADRGVKSAAIVVIDHTTDELLALIGSTDEADPRWGQVHAAFSLRQPGSALKPFVYLSALEQGRTLASIAADVDQAFADVRGAWVPMNYDHKLHGPVRYREALAQSLNVAAVDVLRTGGLANATSVLERAGFSSISRTPDFYGLGLTLGSLDVQLIELAEAYAILARGGVARPTRVLLDDPSVTPPVPLFDPRLTFLIGDALSDPSARAPAFGFSSVLRTPYWTAVKTGTSKGFRDNFCVGWSAKYVVAVWVGDPAGAPMEHISGVSGAGPIWRGVMDRLHSTTKSARPEEPPGLVHRDVCPISGKLRGPRCSGAIDETFVAGTEPLETCQWHREVQRSKSDGLVVPEHCNEPALPPKLETVFPSPFDSWAKEQQTGTSDAQTSKCPLPPAPAKPTLLSPALHEVIRFDPEVPPDRQQLVLLADAGDWPGEVSFLVDDHPVLTRTGARSALWTISRGRHRIVARLDPAGVSSDAHTVVVR